MFVIKKQKQDVIIILCLVLDILFDPQVFHDNPLFRIAKGIADYSISVQSLNLNFLKKSWNKLFVFLFKS